LGIFECLLCVFFNICHHARRAIANVGREHCLGSEEQEEWQFFDPGVCHAFEGSNESLLQAGTNKHICLFELPIGLGMRHKCVLDQDAKLHGEFLKLARGEVSAIVGDDAIGHPVPASDGLEELDDYGRFLIGHRHCFDPLGELVDYDQ
jgi:hypothetical protein